MCRVLTFARRAPELLDGHVVQLPRHTTPVLVLHLAKRARGRTLPLGEQHQARLVVTHLQKEEHKPERLTRVKKKR
jgi:hypothetical protein